MSEPRRDLDRLGGLSLAASGVLFLANSVLERIRGEPPTDGEAILGWVASNQLSLKLSSELLFFALVLMIPAVFALREILAPRHRASGALGCGILAVTISVLAVLDIVQGRLVFPVYGIQARTADVAELLIALYYGGWHAVLLLFAIATLVLSLALRHEPQGAGVAYLGFATAAVDVAASYPFWIGPTWTLIGGVLFAAWFVVLGARIYRSGRALAEPTGAPGAAAPA